MGLQTVTWLLDGELVHYDSLGSESLLRPGGVNVMTSGDAIAHAERTPAKNNGEVAGYSGAAPRCAEPPQVCESEPGELNCWVSTTADLPVVFDSHTC
jgi:hypothetical protein